VLLTSVTSLSVFFNVLIFCTTCLHIFKSDTDLKKKKKEFVGRNNILADHMRKVLCYQERRQLYHCMCMPKEEYDRYGVIGGI